MPIYEYTCRQCAASFEELIQSGANDEALQCPQCGSADVQKQMSTFAGRVSPDQGAGASEGSCPSGGCCFGSCGL